MRSVLERGALSTATLSGYEVRSPPSLARRRRVSGSHVIVSMGCRSLRDCLGNRRASVRGWLRCESAPFLAGTSRQRVCRSKPRLEFQRKEGLLTEVERAPSGHRRYRRSDVEMLDLIKCLRDTDMPIAQLRAYAELTRNGDQTVPERIAMLRRHHTALTDRVAELRERQERIQEKITYRTRSSGVACCGPSAIGQIVNDPSGFVRPSMMTPLSSTLSVGRYLCRMMTRPSSSTWN